MDRKIKLSWSGEETVITPHMDLCHDLENIIDVPKFVMGMLNQSAKMTECIKIIGAVLRFGGHDVSDNEVYEQLCEAELSELLNIVMEILKKTFPMFFQTPKKKTTSKKVSK